MYLSTLIDWPTIRDGIPTAPRELLRAYQPAVKAVSFRTGA